MIRLCAAAAAGPTAIVNGVGVRHLIGRYGSFLLQSPDDLVGLRVHRGGQERALAILRSSPAQLVVLALQGGDLIIGQEVEHRAGVAVLILDDVPGVVVHGVLRCAEALLHLVPGVALLRGQIVVDSLDRGLGLAAAVCQLCSQSILPLHQRNVGAVEALLHGVGNAVQALLHAVEALKHPGVHGRGDELGTLGRENDGGKHIVGDAVGHLGNDVGRGGVYIRDAILHYD